MEATLIADRFKELFNNTPLCVRSPGRINLIGEHTDYNDGFVLPAAIDRAIVFAASKSDSKTARIYSVDFDDSIEVDLRSIQKSEKGWANYIIGVLDQLKQVDASISGFDCVFGGDIPIGSGMSSSAALECGLAYTLNELFELNLEKFELASMAQRAENEFVGVRCGIMDQFANIFGMENRVIKLDCRSGEFEYYDADFTGCRIVLCDTQVKHSLAATEYNNRRAECERGVSIISNRFPEVRSLRDCCGDMLNRCKEELGEVLYKRCNYVVKENLRVTAACQNLLTKQMNEFGEKMYDSHEGLKSEYEVSCLELDILVDMARNHDAVIGARMMGGGFGGCTINIVKSEQLKKLHQKSPTL